VLLIADTRVEDPDLWRFAHESSVHIGVEPTIVADGRTPFEVFHDQRFLGNSRLAPCSAILKQRPARAWLTEHADPPDTVLYVGIDWTETRWIPAIEHGWAPWTVRFPMCDPPLLSKQDMLDAARAAGLEPPRLYELGFSHNFSPDEAASTHAVISSPALSVTMKRLLRHQRTVAGPRRRYDRPAGHVSDQPPSGTSSLIKASPAGSSTGLATGSRPPSTSVTFRNRRTEACYDVSST
jgi:hypothetical protein